MHTRCPTRPYPCIWRFAARVYTTVEIVVQVASILSSFIVTYIFRYTLHIWIGGQDGCCKTLNEVHTTLSSRKILPDKKNFELYSIFPTFASRSGTVFALVASMECLVMVLMMYVAIVCACLCNPELLQYRARVDDTHVAQHIEHIRGYGRVG
jgi:hypothetical protein